MKANAPDLKWSCSLRTDKIGKTDPDLLWEGGCRSIFSGIERASQNTLDKINKGANLKKQIEVTEAAIEQGFSVETSFIVGFPWETRREAIETFELCCDMLKKRCKKEPNWDFMPFAWRFTRCRK